MLRSLKVLETFRVHATDGDIGSVVNFLMDDETWTVRYLVVDTGGLGGRQVLVSPIFFDRVDYSASSFCVKLTMEKVKNSPSVDLNQPVSRQHEQKYYDYNDSPSYWGYGGLWGLGGYPGALASAAYPVKAERPADRTGDPHLRSARELAGCHIEATDGAIGHVKDFMVDDEIWEVRYLVVDTTNWWPGKSVLLAPQWATRIEWADRKVFLGMSRDAIRRSPEWGVSIDREYEEILHRHYGRIPGWASRDRGFAEATPAICHP